MLIDFTRKIPPKPFFFSSLNKVKTKIRVQYTHTIKDVFLFFFRKHLRTEQNTFFCCFLLGIEEIEEGDGREEEQ